MHAAAATILFLFGLVFYLWMFTDIGKTKMKRSVLFAVVVLTEYNDIVGYFQPLLVLTNEDDWQSGNVSDEFEDYVYSSLDAFGLEEIIEGIFEPVTPMDSENLALIARSVGFRHSVEFEEAAKLFNIR